MTHEKWDKGKLIERTETEDPFMDNNTETQLPDKSIEVTKKWWEFWK